MPALADRYLDAIRTLAEALAEQDVVWALTGSTSFALQGVPVEPDDIDVQTTEAGAYDIEGLFSDRITDTVSFSESESIRSHFGALELGDVRVELMGALQKRREDGTWEPPVEVRSHREFVTVERMEIPVLSPRYEARAYEQLGRRGRAELLRKYADSR